LGLNHRRAPLNNLLVRRAIAHALDRHAIIDGAMFGYGTPIGSHFPPQARYVDLTARYPHDVANREGSVGAGRVLRRVFGRAQAAAAELRAAQRRNRRRTARRDRHQGQIENLEWAQWLDQVFTRHDFDMSIVGHAEPMDYDIYARDDYYFGYSNAEFKALIAALDDTVEPRERDDLLQAIQRKLAEDAVNGFLFQYPRLDIWNVHLHGSQSTMCSASST
jgi:peptide/nickel transport system substrate-binding protein